MHATTFKFFLLALLVPALQASAQVTAVKPYNPTGTNRPAPQTYSNEYQSDASYEAAARRAQALAKVQGAATPRQVSVKGLTPAQYSTDGYTPTQYSTESISPTTVTVNGNNVYRDVRKGRGQVGDKLFTPVAELHFVQFAVYCKNTPVDKAPPIEGLMLLWHAGSKCPGGEPGASYIVKGYETAEDAKDAVLRFKANRIDCWYNPALTGAAVEVIGVR
jgi:hypothetical protein